MPLILCDNLQIFVFALSCCERYTSALFQGGLFHVSAYMAQPRVFKLAFVILYKSKQKLVQQHRGTSNINCPSLTLGFRPK